ncbi:leucine-rich repeat-containing protein 14 [Neoarius graeffei]|uniref:leucine-rich repeat-containing protein 14 n=1 Tax=Neoarius graeffei TaxID=443677 RepID=UPI00298CEE7C|nr:leucine-rich repeat-containing protein 14 [Neoarius graeffei]XP_060771570.1 leucine-rich repeat-containing protein 14 [Neoarius graeffei]XP_060771573.1 leucine-rich repeat-containing protein 14 [Neoarius graeffei]
MVLSLVYLCAREVVSDHGLLAAQLSCVPRELYRPLLDAAFTHCRPLAIGELVQRWPERILSIGGRRKCDRDPPGRLCVQAVLHAVVRGLIDNRCCLQVLDLCGLQYKDGSSEDAMGGWSLTVALCAMLLRAKNVTTANRGRGRDDGEKKKRGLETEQDGAVKRDRAGLKKGEEEAEVQKMDCRDNAEEENVKGVRRRMELQRRKTAHLQQVPSRDNVLVDVKADLFVNTRSWGRVRRALSLFGSLRLHCRFLRVEELPASSIASLLHLLPQEELLGLDVRYSSLGVSGLALLLPQLAPFPRLCSLRLHYCNLDVLRIQPGQQEALQDVSRGLGELKRLRRLSLTALCLSGHLRLLLSSLSEPLEALELLYLSLTAGDLTYLSRSPHASSLTELDLSENRLDESSLHSLRHLFARAKHCLTRLSLCGCGLSDSPLRALLPALEQCHALRSLCLALNPLSRAALVDLARAAAGINSLRLLLYPNPLEEYEPGLPPLPSSTQLFDWPLTEDSEVKEVTLRQLDEVLRAKGRTLDLLLTSDLLKYSTDLAMDD